MKRNDIFNSEQPNITVAMPPAATKELADPGLYNYWFDFDNRIYCLYGDVDPSLMDLVDWIIRINIEDKDTPIEERKPLVILFHSGGGDIDIQRIISNTIEMSDTPVVGIAMGMVASSASQIYLSCHYKMMYPSAYFIFHQGSARFEGTYAEIKAAMADYELTVEALTKEYISKTGFSEDEIREGLMNDWYIYADTAIEKGIADTIITDFEIFTNR